MNNLKIIFGVLLALSASRFIPHPPNFTSLLALSFYIPALFGIRHITTVIFALLFTDMILGFHSIMPFTFGSIILIGLISNYFNKSIIYRIMGALIGALIFFIITNFGVWTLGSYGYDLNGIVLCYTLALPFFAYSIISTIIFSVVIETVLKFKFIKLKNKKII